MKSFISKTSFLVLSVVLFVGCGGGLGKDEPEFTSMEGTLEDQKSGDDFAGTHLLIDEDGLETPVRSLKINLSDKNYLHNKVDVTGFMSEDDVFQIDSIEVLEVVDGDEEKGKFVEYVNDKLGFKLKYYDDWKIDDNAASIVMFTSPDKDMVEVRVIDYAYVPDVDENGDALVPLESYFLTEAGVDDIRPLVNKVGPDKLDAVKTERADGGIEYSLYRAGKIYQISYIPSEDSKSDVEVDIAFDAMMAELVFIPISESASEEVVDEAVEEEVVVEEMEDFGLTAIFESLPYHFSGNYPSDWYYAGSKSSTDGVLHHYAFSDEIIEDSNELLRLDVLSSIDLPSGSKVEMNGENFTVVNKGEEVEVYTVLEDRAYRIQGPSEYRDLMLQMGASLHPLVEEETSI